MGTQELNKEKYTTKTFSKNWLKKTVLLGFDGFYTFATVKDETINWYTYTPSMTPKYHF